MKTVNVLDLIGTDEAILRGFGEHVFLEIENDLKKNEEIILSFYRIKKANILFFMPLLANLYRSFPEKMTKGQVKFEHISDSRSLQEFQDALHFVTHPEDTQIWNNFTEEEDILQPK